MNAMMKEEAPRFHQLNYLNVSGSSKNESSGSTEESHTLSSVGYANCESSHHDFTMDTRELRKLDQLWTKSTKH
ncbi:hypothetical protein JHK87_001548 [Glycine soja]|nr:hypothetical protein JHK87_001548 [Glycine soja]